MATRLTLTEMAHGGAALGRDENGRVLFVPYAIPGETVAVTVREKRRRYATGRLEKVVTPADSRVAAPCPHFGVCGGCHFQHIDYPAQLAFKRQVVRDQLARIAGLKEANVHEVLASPQTYDYQVDLVLSPAAGGGLGFWSPSRREVIAIETCLIAQPALRTLLADIDLELPGLRKLTLRVGDDEALLAALEVEGVEPPALETDFPISVSIVLPDGTAANLVGDNYVIVRVKERDFRVSAGVYCPPNPAAAALLVDSVVAYAGLSGAERVLEGYSGAGHLTAFLAPRAGELIAVERQADAVADAVVNLDDGDNVLMYEGAVEAVLPALTVQPDVVVVDPPATGLATAALDALLALRTPRLVYASSNLGTLARDARRLAQAGYRLVEVQPIDIFPQNFEIVTVSRWER